MHRVLLAQAVLAGMLVIVSTADAGGGGGSSGGRGGDSSMNPFTGDSYAYFNCGHNLGEQGMIIPGRPNPQSPEEKARRAANPPAPTRTCVPSQVLNGSRNEQTGTDGQARAATSAKP